MPDIQGGGVLDLLVGSHARRHVLLRTGSRACAFDLCVVGASIVTFGETGESLLVDVVYDGSTLRFVNNEAAVVSCQIYDVIIKTRMEI